MEENCQFVKDCIAAKPNDKITRKELTFDEVFQLMYPIGYEKDLNLRFTFGRFEIYAVTKKDYTMSVWQGHNAEPEDIEHLCKAGTKVRVWMVSRMGDCGITDNLKDPKGYDCRGVECEDLCDWELVRMR